MEEAGFLAVNSIAAFWSKRRVGPAIVLGQATALLGRLTKASFLRNVFVVMTGSAIGQAVGFALSPVISRLFTPADFGVFGSFGAVTGVFAAIVTLDYSLAVMLPRQQGRSGTGLCALLSRDSCRDCAVRRPCACCSRAG